MNCSTTRVWDELGKELPRDRRAQAKGKPVLAHPETDRIIAVAHETAYALCLTPADYADALKAQGRCKHGDDLGWRRCHRLAKRAGTGRIWGRWYAGELTA